MPGILSRTSATFGPREIIGEPVDQLLDHVDCRCELVVWQRVAVDVAVVVHTERQLSGMSVDFDPIGRANDNLVSFMFRLPDRLEPSTKTERLRPARRPPRRLEARRTSSLNGLCRRSRRRKVLEACRRHRRQRRASRWKPPSLRRPSFPTGSSPECRRRAPSRLCRGPELIKPRVPPRILDATRREEPPDHSGPTLGTLHNRSTRASARVIASIRSSKDASGLLRNGGLYRNLEHEYFDRLDRDRPVRYHTAGWRNLASSCRLHPRRRQPPDGLFSEDLGSWARILNLLHLGRSSGWTAL
jgi:hypothetical protein